MKKTKLLAIVFIALATMSCSKEEGCEDSNAVNYSSTAEKDDGSCTYKSSVVFYQREVNAQELVDAGVVSLTYYINDKIEGSSSAAVFWTGSSDPDCDVNGAVTVNKDLGTLKTQSQLYKVKDQDDNLIYSGSINFNANTCLALELK